MKVANGKYISGYLEYSNPEDRHTSTSEIFLLTIMRTVISRYGYVSPLCAVVTHSLNPLKARSKYTLAGVYRKCVL